MLYVCDAMWFLKASMAIFFSHLQSENRMYQRDRMGTKLALQYRVCALGQAGCCLLPFLLHTIKQNSLVYFCLIQKMRRKAQIKILVKNRLWDAV